VPDPVELAVIGECHLDIQGLRSQQQRYRELGRHVTQATRRPQRLTIAFDAEIPVDLLEETVRVERACCPFFVIEPSSDLRSLTITVSDASQDPALDAIAHALEVAVSRSATIGP
jgi:hypothetical protein